MKTLPVLLLLISLLFSCREPVKNSSIKETGQTPPQKERGSPVQVTVPEEKITGTGRSTNDTVQTPPPGPEQKAGKHPVSLHWLGWDRLGSATVAPAGDGWYKIKGSHRRGDEGHLLIDGKIRRVSPRELAFEGTIETRHITNYDGKPCIKTGPQIFLATGSRTYYRLQDMGNCMGERVVDYVDIFPGSSGL